MKRIFFVAVILVFFGIAGSAQENPLRLYGGLQTDHRFRLGNGNWSWNENRLELKLDKKFADKARFRSDVWLRSFGYPFLQSAEQLFNKDELSPYNLDLREAYVELYGVFTKNLDMKIGRQRIAWGTADKLNPTDNLNPWDLEDIWDFGRHSGSDAIQLKYYIKDFYLEGDYILYFRPAGMPRGDWAEGLMASPVELPDYLTLGTVEDSLAMPALNLKGNATYAFKFGGFAVGFDFSASYVYGRDGLPLNYYNKISLAEKPGEIDVKSYLLFPRQHIIGADLAGAIGNVGIWAEGAAFLPEKEIKLTNDLSAFGMPAIDSVVLEKKPWFKYAAGMDYTFKGGHYINIQYLHGFVHERGHGNLNDYLVLSYEKYLFNKKLKINPFTSAMVVSDWEKPGENFAWIYMPAITYIPNENTEINLGVRLIGGEGDDMFTKYKDKDEFVLSVRYKF